MRAIFSALFHFTIAYLSVENLFWNAEEKKKYFFHFEKYLSTCIGAYYMEIYVLRNIEVEILRITYDRGMIVYRVVTYQSG